jgi:sulfite oxidase
MACAGNRRSHTRKHYGSAVKGVNWDIGAIGNNEYTGVLIKDLLIDSGLIT